MRPPSYSTRGSTPTEPWSIPATTFSFASSPAGARFECKLDKAPFKPCRSPFKRKVKPGRHVFAVRAVDTAGKADPTPARFRWQVS